MALKIEIVGLDWEIINTVYVLVLGKSEFRLVPRIVDFMTKLWNNLAVQLLGMFERIFLLVKTIINKQLIQNWHGPGESDCLIKTKHCDGPNGC